MERDGVGVGSYQMGGVSGDVARNVEGVDRRDAKIAISLAVIGMAVMIVGISFCNGSQSHNSSHNASGVDGLDVGGCDDSRTSILVTFALLVPAVVFISYKYRDKVSNLNFCWEKCMLFNSTRRSSADETRKLRQSSEGIEGQDIELARLQGERQPYSGI